MGRRSVVEGTHHPAELFVDAFLAVAGDPEGLVHDFRAVVADRAGGQFDAVADDVVLPGQDLQWVPGLEAMPRRLS